MPSSSAMDFEMAGWVMPRASPARATPPWRTTSKKEVRCRSRMRGSSKAAIRIPCGYLLGPVCHFSPIVDSAHMRNCYGHWTMAVFLSLRDAVANNLHDGDTVAFEGFTHLIPHAAAHEAIRQGIKDLTLLRMTPDIIYDQMIGMGLARKVVFSYVGNPGVGLLRRMRAAIATGYPRAIETIEHSHSAMAQAYEAGASGLPCAIFRGYKGAGLF